MSEKTTIHGTAVAIDGHGVLLLGKPGSGKSDLALRLIDRGAVLVGDDAVVTMRRENRTIISPAENIAGSMEVRHLGILHFDHAQSAPLSLCVELDGMTKRYPEQNLTIDIAGYSIPKIVINAFEASAPIKVELALREVTRHDARHAED